MGYTKRSIGKRLVLEERSVQQRLSAFRRQRMRAAMVSGLGPEEPFPHTLVVAPDARGPQRDELILGRLAEKLQALAQAQDRVRQGTYGFCQACGDRIPCRRLEVLPTAILCVPCQEQREGGRAA
jgi:RNA polymerase-binding transcription factor DksA